MEPKVRSFERTVAFVASPSRPVFVVQDELSTESPTTFEFLLHALNRMETDSRTGAIFVRDGDARLAIRLVSTKPLKFTQTDRFAVAPEAAQSSACAASPKDCEAKFPKQWHFNARTTAPTDEVKFAAVMVPYRAGETAPEISVGRSGDTVVFQVKDTVIAAWMGAGTGGQLAMPGAAAAGRLAVRSSEGGKTGNVVVQ